MTIATGSPILAADVVSTSSGAGDSGKIPKLGATGELAAGFLPTRALTVFPRPVNISGTGTDLTTARTVVTNTTAAVGKIRIDQRIFAKQVSIRVTGAPGVNGTFKIGLFSEDGQTQYFSVTTASVTAAGVYTTSFTAVNIPAGVYIIAIVPVGTASAPILMWGDSGSFIPLLSDSVSGTVNVNGTYTVTASTMPSTITPASITATSTVNWTAVIRLDA
jgi:hypothetical protein